MDVLFLSCAYSDTQKDMFMKASRRGFQFAAQNLQEALIDGFLLNDVNLTVLSVPSLSSYPKACRLLRIKKDSFFFKGQKCGSTVGYLNLPFIKSWNKRRVRNRLEVWYANAGERKVIFIYALLKNQMLIALDFKKKHPDVKLAVIVPDLPRFMGYNGLLKKLGFQKRDIESIYGMARKFDAFVVLSQPMLEDLHVQDKKFVVVEGIYSGLNEDIDIKKADGKVILYTGNIGKRYGIDLLMNAFSEIKNPEYRLWIRGTGDNTEILTRAQEDSRIKYIGPLSKKELIELQKQATLLVNPVSPENEFTKYFFPSKTMDYLASGTPTVMFKLECLPTEYNNYLFFFKEPTANSMAETIESICNSGKDNLNSFGKAASSFIRDEKNAFKQVEKIIDMFNGLF